MTAPVRVESGFLWSGLAVTTASGREVVRGFSVTALQPIEEALNRGLRRHAQGHLSAAAAPLTSAGQQIAALLSSSTYIRDSERRQTLAGVTAALSVRDDPFWKAFSTQAQRHQAGEIGRFVVDSESLVVSANEALVAAELDLHAGLFDGIESKPLTSAQRRACVVCEDRNLVLAGAGTGKTSTMIGRAGYLMATGHARADQILMLAYAKKAAGEMQERQDARLGKWCPEGTPKVSTFHAMGLDIIRKVEGRGVDVTPMAEDPVRLAQFIDRTMDELCDDADYRAKLIRYITTERFPYRSYFDFASMQEYEEYVRTYELRTLAGELVKSFEEVAVANFLNSQGVAYEYERPYPVDTADATHRRYSPDFYLPQYDIYIEHFALDRAGRAPEYFAPGYAADADWKRALHKQHGTTLLETFSYMKREGILDSSLAAQLEAAGVRYSPRDEMQLLKELRESSEVKQVADLLGGFLGLFKQANSSLPTVRAALEAHKDKSRLLLLVDLFAPVLEVYEADLAKHGQIDFADMIRRATAYVEAGRFVSPFTHILVDEFQDISAVRANLVIALLRQRQDSVLFAVGDDWQSIYRFTGSDIGYTWHFARVFGATATTALDTTFRFNSSIGNVASYFVLQNPSQTRKTVRSLVDAAEPAVSLLGALSREDGLKVALEAIAKRESYGSSARATVLVLARYKFVLEEWPSEVRRRLKQEYPSLSIDFMTVHAAKGREADYVVVLGLEKGRNGFPANKPVDALLEILLPKSEDFAFAEERRLFYVAMTRARRRVYLVYNPMEASPFVSELRDESHPYPVRVDEFAGHSLCMELPHVACPKCGSGALVPREGESGRFVGCNNYPRCDHTEQLCPQCGSLMRRRAGARACTNPECNAVVRLCPKCGGSMVERSGPHGKFLGCSNYYREGCRYKEQSPSVRNRGA
jgi:DNA helicase-4